MTTLRYHKKLVANGEAAITPIIADIEDVAMFINPNNNEIGETANETIYIYGSIKRLAGFNKYEN